jgi:hypothetical protein
MEMLDDHGKLPISSYIDRYKRNPLHWACIKGASLSFLNALIENYPEATVMKDYLGRTPLHLACEHACDQIVFSLLRVTDPVVTKYRESHNLRSLLAEAIVNNRSPLIIDAILQADTNQIAMKDSQGNGPVVLFFRMNLGTILGKHRGVPLTSESSNLDDLVDIAAMLLQAEVKLEMGIETEAHKSLLANAIQCPTCPFEFVAYLMSEFPDQIGHVTTGDLPIHAACRAHDQELGLYKCDSCKEAKMRHVAYFFSHSNRTLRHVLCNDCIDENEKTGYTRLSPMQKIQETMKAILIANEKYASALTTTGETPLALSLKSGHTWSLGAMEELIKACPSLLSQRDITTNLYPFQLSATQRNLHYGDDEQKKNIDTLTTTFEILRKSWPLANR